MLIRSINTVFMKHSRWLFAVFTVVIIVSFLGFMVPGQFGMGGCGNPADAAMGQAYGENVSYREAMEAIRGFVIVQELMIGRSYDAGNYDYGFYLVAQRKAAVRRGLTASNDEVTALFRECTAFRKQGKFDYDVYNRIMGNLRQRGMDGDFIVGAFRDEVLRGKLNREITETVIPTDGEEQMFYRFYNGEFRIAVADFRAADYLKQVKPDAKALQEWFKLRRKDYVIPAQMTALVVEIPFSGQMAKVKADPAALQKYFSANAAKFAGKDGKPVSFDAVKGKVQKAYAEAQARTMTAALAQRFARDVYDQVGDGAGKDDIFRKEAGKYKFNVIRTARFGADASAIGKIAEPELIKQMDQVLKSVPVTNAVMGKSAVYVGYVLTREEPRQAEWKEVSARATEDYRQLEAMKLARKAAADASVRLAKLPADKRALDKVWSKRYTLSLWGAMRMMPDQLPPMQVLGILPSLTVNEVSRPMPDTAGAAIVMVTGWKAPDMAAFNKDRQLWQGLWMRQKISIQTAEFQRDMENSCKLFQDRRK